jgi:predicted RNase H-like HicB family nuclease
LNEYVVIYERAAGGGWGAYLPDVPGVVAVGATREQVAELIQEALRAYVEEMTGMGRDMPEPAHAAGVLRV